MIRSRISRTGTVLAICGLAGVLGAGVAIANENQKPSTKPATATFSATVQKTHVTTCQGTDGTYHQDQTISTGTSTGDDPRLTGDITVASRSLINVTTGYGTSTGTITLRDTTTHKVLSEATFTAVNTYNGVLHGFEIGRLKGTASLPPATLFANFSAMFNNTGTAFTGTLGGNSAAPPPNQPAVIQSGSCGGSEEHD